MNKSKTPGAGIVAILANALVAVLTPSAAAAEPLEIVVLGDSLSAGFELPPGDSFPEQLETALKQRGHDVTVANAGVSGDTASDGLARLEWSVPAEADIVIVELGANDALRGIDPKTTRQALSEIVTKLKGRGQDVLLAGMLAPRNLGDAYVREFDAIYPGLASEHDVALYPFFLAGVATETTLNLADGMHPSAAGVATIVDGIVGEVEKLLETVATGG